MKIIVGAMGAAALLLLAPAVEAQVKGGGPKGVPNYSGYVPHQKTGGNHPGGHSSVTGHRNSGGSYSSGHVHNGCHGHPAKPVARCFPPGHCKSINDKKPYYGPPGQR